MNLTNYRFEFAVCVETLNSITNVARLPGSRFATVFTSGIHPYVDDETSGPTEKFVHNYGTRVHHIAFRMENIEATFDTVRNTGMEFLVDLVGSDEEGLKQTFSVPSANTLLVNEYICRGPFAILPEKPPEIVYFIAKNWSTTTKRRQHRRSSLAASAGTPHAVTPPLSCYLWYFRQNIAGKALKYVSSLENRSSWGCFKTCFRYGRLI
jgi:hypothetical protein